MQVVGCRSIIVGLTVQYQVDPKVVFNDACYQYTNKTIVTVSRAREGEGKVRDK